MNVLGVPINCDLGTALETVEGAGPDKPVAVIERGGVPESVTIRENRQGRTTVRIMTPVSSCPIDHGAVPIKPSPMSSFLP